MVDKNNSVASAVAHKFVNMESQKISAENVGVPVFVFMVGISTIARNAGALRYAFITNEEANVKSAAAALFVSMEN